MLVNHLTDLVQWSALIGFLLPLLVAIVQQSHWSSKVRTIIGVIAVLVTSFVTTAVEGKLTWDRWAESLVVVFVLAMTAYKSVWVPLGAAPFIEAKTSTKPAKP
jgi:hypothetical protein